MNKPQVGILDDWDATAEEILEAMGHAIRNALKRHRDAGVPVATMRGNRVVLISAEELSSMLEDAEPEFEAETP